MTPPETLQSAPYDITPRVWRDEQPGDDPRLVLSVTFAPRTTSERWQDVRIVALELRADSQRWAPRESTVAPFGDGGFEVKAFGDATLPAGTRAMIAMTLQTSGGEKKVQVEVEITRVG